MAVQASPTALPERPACLARVQGRFRRPEGRDALARDPTGRRTEGPTTHGDPRAQAGPGTRAQRVQAFRTNRPWDEEDLNRQCVHKRRAEASPGDGVVVVDAPGVPKQGRAAVGGERQDAGPLGQVGHGQLAVTCGDPERRATWSIAVQLSLPTPWAYDPERRQRARVPAARGFWTKPESAVARLDQARAWGVPHRGIVVAAADGENPNVLAGVEVRQERYVVGGRADCAVRLRPVATSRGWRAEELRETVPRWPWRVMRWRRGRTGWRRPQVVARRGWRLGARAPRGQPAARKECWSPLPAETTLAARAGRAQRRPALEPLHAEAKGALGWDQAQGRRWPGVHRHAVTVRLASSLLVWRERRERRRHRRPGRPRAAVSPAAPRPATDAPGGAA